MKKTGKRLITLLIALSMLLAIGVTTTGAETETDRGGSHSR